MCKGTSIKRRQIKAFRACKGKTGSQHNRGEKNEPHGNLSLQKTSNRLRRVNQTFSREERGKNPSIQQEGGNKVRFHTGHSQMKENIWCKSPEKKKCPRPVGLPRNSKSMTKGKSKSKEEGQKHFQMFSGKKKRKGCVCEPRKKNKKKGGWFCKEEEI